MKWLKVKAGALQLTMFVTVVVALILSSFILLVHTHKQFNVQTDFVIETVDNANYGISYALNNPLKLNESIEVNLKDEDYKTLTLKKDYWGLFEKITSSSSIKNKTFQKVALIGTAQPENKRTALFLEEHNKPLVVVGNTKIQGTSYIPKKGIRAGNISGHSYYGSQLLYGQSKLSKKLPELNTEVLNHIKSIHNITDKIEPNQYIDIDLEKTSVNSFSEPLRALLSIDEIMLKNVSLAGHIVVKSNTKITVDASAKLRDVLLIAPVIEIKENVTGSFQAFATKSITIGKHCSLNYPTALVLNTSEKITNSESVVNTNELNQILIGNNSIINGAILYLGKPKSNNYKPHVVLEENATVKGEILCYANLELRGSVFGSVYTSNFVASQSGSIYQNHIYNAQIIIDELPLEYIGLPFKNTNKDILKWLY